MGPGDHPAPPLGVSGGRSRPARRRWQLAVLVLVLVAAAGLSWWLTRSPASVPSRASGISAGSAAPSAVARAQTRAAAWIASQVSDSAIVACDPGLCRILQEQGIAPGRLMPLRATASPSAADVLVTSGSADGPLADRYAAARIASFGSGRSQVEMFAVDPDGITADKAALRADLAARRSAGAQLLHNSHIRFAGPGAARVRAGEIDTRLLATLAVLASRYSFRLTALGDAAPGAPVLFREVVITGIGFGRSAASAHDRAAALAMVRAQDPPYVPAHAVAVGPTGLNIEFALPSPLGLLSPVIGAGSPSPSTSGALSLSSNSDK